MMKDETWRPVDGFEDEYEVSDRGLVRSFERYVENGPSVRVVRSRYMTVSDNGKGYKCVNLSKNNKVKTCYVHRLVMTAFSPTKDKTLEVNHKDGNKCNNALDNLEWVTHKENQEHAAKVLKVMRGPKNRVSNRRKAAIGVHIATGFVIYLPSISFSSSLGMKRNRIDRACQGRTKSAYGCKWVYAEDAAGYSMLYTQPQN